MASTRITIEWPGFKNGLEGAFDSGFIGNLGSTGNEFRVVFKNPLIGVERNSKLKIIDCTNGTKSCNVTGIYTVTDVDRSELGSCTLKLEN